MDLMNQINVGSQLSTNLAGMILVATPQLDDSIFEKGLIFICGHDDQGAVGVMFNKPMSEITAKEILSGQKSKKTLKTRFNINKKYPIFRGGPVEESALVVLHATKEQEVKFKDNFELTLSTNADGFLRDVVKGLNKNKFILCQGFCGWAPSQLEQEISENSWILIDADFKTIFSKSPEKKWEKIVKKLGIGNFNKLVSYSGNA